MRGRCPSRSICVFFVAWAKGGEHCRRLMAEPNSPIERHRPAHPQPLDRPDRETIVFLTVCTKNRQRILATQTAHEILRTVWSEGKFWMVGRYAILPDHVHLFCAPSAWPMSELKSWVGYWKNRTARLLRERLGEEHGPGPVWQRDFWDTQLRRSQSYGEKWEYVRQNPVRHGLAASAEEWPYQGELDSLMWRER